MGILCVCQQCGAEFLSYPSRVKQGGGKYCSAKCKAIAVNKSRIKMPGGVVNHPLYQTWANMRSRCNNSEHQSYEYYGARGIKVCDRWNDFFAFIADMGERPEGLTLDRIDSDGDYEPANCRWADRAEQVANRRTSLKYNGTPLKVVCEEKGLSYRTVWKRIKNGWSIEDALNRPVRPLRPRRPQPTP